MKKLFIGTLALMIGLGLGIAIGQNTSNYMEQGGARWVIGGSLDVASGGDLDVESGGAFKIAGTQVTATATELNLIDGVTATTAELNFCDVTAGTATASKALVLSAGKAIATITSLTSTALVCTNLDAGASGTAGTVDIFPSTASKGKLAITAADSAGDTTTTIVNASQAGARTYTIPDAGAAANFVLSTGTSTSIAKTSTELNQIVLTVRIPDISSAQSAWVVSPMAGNITKVYTVINGAIAVGDATITLELAGTLVTDSSITIANAGSAAGDVDSSTPSAANAVTAGQAIEVITDGGSTNAVEATVTIVIDIT